MLVKLSLGLLRVLTKILLLEDDMLFAETLIDLLDDEGYEITYAPNGQTALDFTFTHKFDIYLFDINVPLINGITLLQELRSSSDNTPTIFLTSHRDKDILSKAFSSGADDYLKKPFDNNELLFRIEAILRRTQKDIPNCIALLCHDKIHKSFSYNNILLNLSNKEYQLLLLFVHNINKVVPKEMIIDRLWSNSQTHSDGAIRVYINKLKQFLPDIKIENIRGIGYKLTI